MGEATMKDNPASWKADITLEDMPNNDLKLVAEHCGIAVAITLIENMGGLSIYIPGETFSFRKPMKRYIAKTWDGKNTKELARELGVSLKMIYKILQESSADGKLKNPNQLNLLDHE
jgi:Mor family transcriptional regulator